MKKTGKRICIVLYLLLLLVLGGSIIIGSDYIWSACEEYQANSAKTILLKAVEEIEQTSGVEGITYDPVHSVNADGDSTYKVRNGADVIGEVKLSIKKKGLLTLVTPEAELFFHPNMAHLRLKNLRFGDGDRMAEAMDLKPAWICSPS